jgi:hypothetical protein
MEARKRITLYISMLMIVLLIIGVSYAYFAATITGNETSTTITGTAGTISLTFAGGANITATNLAPDSDPFAAKNFTVTSNNTTDKTSTYNLNLVIDENGFASGNIKYTLTGTNTSSNGKEVTTIADQKDIGTGTGTYYLGMGYFTNGTSKVHTYALNLYSPESNADQSADMGKTIRAHVTIEANESYVATPGVAATVLKDLAGHKSGVGGMKTIAHDATGNQTYATTDYRYYGSNPNNYVQFNDELWRIIGVFEVEDDTGTKAYRVKLIRNDFIGYYSYDTSASTVNSGYGINEWSQADLMKLLNPGYESNQDLNNSGATITVNNSLYWTKGSGTCYNGQSNATTTCNFTSTGLGATAKSMIDKTKYYIGGWNDYNTTSTQFYNYERGSNVIASPSDGVTRTTTWTGYVGLPYISDYGYATDESICLNTEYVGFNTSTGYYPHTYCHTNDWMWREFIFLLGYNTPFS